MRFPLYIQHDQMDCGPTCLRMVAKHYGRHFSAQTMREKAQIGKEGVSLLGIAEGAEAIGLRALGIKVSFEQLAEEAQLPCIVHWQQNHFVVVYDIKLRSKWKSKLTTLFGSKPSVEEFDATHQATSYGAIANTNGFPVEARGTVFVADPNRGLTSYTVKEFRQGWLNSYADNERVGMAMLLEPSPAFYEQDEEADTNYSLGRVLNYVGQYKQLLAQLILGLSVGSALQLLVPFLTQSVVDIGINTQNLPFIYLVLGAQLMVMAGRLTVEFIQSWILLHVSTRVNLSILSDFLIKLMRLPLSFFDTKHYGDIMQRIGDHQRIESFVTGQAVALPFALANILVLSVVVALYSLPIFGIYVISNVLYVGWIMLFLRHRRKLDTKRFTLSARSQSALVQIIQGMQDLKLAGAERQSRWSWERLQANLFRWQMSSLTLGQYQQVGAFLINDGKNILITCLAAQAVIQGQMTLGQCWLCNKLLDS
ncbi:cysteine peptidase family C39 domain-containing protein [Hymenobacter sp. BRD128]|uniref:cysteine peptidase family C39 domain-containing protein n=1 Tax=Hymenobacter sp. BRD128 TaxID=2675878 RepID=UPI00349F3230